MANAKQKYTQRATEFLAKLQLEESVNDATIKELRRLLLSAFSEGVEVGAKLNAE